MNDYFNISWAPDAGNPWKIDENQHILKNYFNISWAPYTGNPWKIDENQHILKNYSNISWARRLETYESL